jgi:hypothetical protein
MGEIGLGRGFVVTEYLYVYGNVNLGNQHFQFNRLKLYWELCWDVTKDLEGG